MCLLGVEEYARTRHTHAPETVRVDYEDMCLVIVDESDKELKKQPRSSFRVLRPKWRPSTEEWAKAMRLWHVHDDFYFGDSRESVGLQLADLCCWLTLQHLKQRIPDELFDAIKPHVVCAKPEPEWTQLKDFLRCHG